MKSPKIIVFFALMLLMACESNYSPKPSGYFRIDTPKQEYQPFNEDCPFKFDYNKAVRLKDKGNCWYDLRYPSLKATLQLTYRQVTETNLDTLLKEGHALAYEHTVKADGIDEKLFLNEEERVFGLMYKLKGDAATSLQFFMTDSTDHFLRGVLYFYASPNADSLRPVNQFMESELMHLIESLEWGNL